MSTDLYIDPLTHDLELIDGKLRLTTTLQELARQKVEITLSTFRGEWFADINYGIPYLANDNNPIQLLGATNKRFLDIAIKEGILETDEIVKINSYSSEQDRQTRVVTPTFEAESVTGEIISFEAVEINI